MGTVDQERVQRIRSEMARAGLDAVVCRLAENVLVFSGYWPNIDYSMVVFPLEGDPVLIAPQFERDIAEEGWIADLRTYGAWQIQYPHPNVSLARMLRQVAEEKKLRGKRIGYEGNFEYIAPSQLAAEPTVPMATTRQMIHEAFGDAQYVDATTTIDAIRAVKTARDIEKLRLVNEIAGIGLQAYKEHAEPGRRACEVAAAVEAAIYGQGVGYKGARFARGYAQVTGGPMTAIGWEYPRSKDRRLEVGDLVFIELATVVDGYWSDLTRTRVCGGKPSAKQQEVWEAQQAGHNAGIAAMRPGVRTVDVDAAARRAIAERGYNEYFFHHTGHGIGWKYHEPIPWLHPDSKDTLEVGHVFAFEPGIYIEGFGGIRVEDNIVVTPDGVEVLSTFERGLV